MTLALKQYTHMSDENIKIKCLKIQNLFLDK